MAVRSRDELMESIRVRLGDDASDDALTLIEDFNDTLTDYETRTSDDWKSKYDALDSDWRRRYKERFFQSPGDPETTGDAVVADNQEDLISESEPKSFDSLFAEKEVNSGY